MLMISTSQLSQYPNSHHTYQFTPLIIFFVLFYCFRDDEETRDFPEAQNRKWTLKVYTVRLRETECICQPGVKYIGPLSYETQ